MSVSSVDVAYGNNKNLIHFHLLVAIRFISVMLNCSTLSKSMLIFFVCVVHTKSKQVSIIYACSFYVRIAPCYTLT